ncbi:hypothetical protein B9Z55_007899 [Caenorhabditis nigoni]|uniref:BTB domain-containing protein n=1 Tax=Caenorhabditis nigoni TaxID=1611254 RepID=A0A2G5VBQ4_9PELO|nr:hypothetical protein B9Z55_007899 [Caenorhabditis nigoni]
MTTTVKLNVGGTIFQTTQTTLTKFDGFFRTMFETPIPVPRDASETIFIDRDPTHFRLILNFMRDGHVNLQKYSEDVSEIQKEAEYYLLNGLVELCERIQSENQKPVEIKELKDDRDEMNAILGLKKEAFVVIYTDQEGVFDYRQAILNLISKYEKSVDFYTAPHKRGPGWNRTAFKVVKKSSPFLGTFLNLGNLESVLRNLIPS